jgi:cell division protein FtsQ
MRGPVLGVVAVLVLAGLGWLVTASPWLSVRTVTVSGAIRAQPAEIRAAAQIPTGQALVWVRPHDVRARLERLPGVASAQVERRWPDRVHISVTEPRPVARLGAQRPHAQPLLLSATGTLFPIGRGGPGVGLPVVREVPATATSRLRAAATVLTALPESLANRVVAVRVPTAESVTLRLAGGASVVWGGPTQSEQKARVLAALVAQHPSRYYDVSAPGAPATRP